MADAAARHQALRNDANKVAMKIPFFHGTKKEDSLTVKEFIKRFESATDSMALVNQEEKCKMFANYLRGPAFLTWETMVKWKEDVRNWDNVKNYFLTHYMEEENETEFLNKIDELIQKKDEIVNDFGNRCFDAVFDNMNMTFPPDEDMEASGIAVTAAGRAQILESLRLQLTTRWARMFFMIGVKDSIKTTLLQKDPQTMREAMKEAAKLERVQRTKKSEHKNRIAMLADLDDEELRHEEIDEDDVSAINGQRAKQGRQPFKRYPAKKTTGFRNGNGNGNGNGYRANGNAGPNVCRYCHKPNHLQKECRLRISKGDPCVDLAGKPWKVQPKVHEVEDDEDEDVKKGRQNLKDMKSKLGFINQGNPLTLNF